MSGVYSSPKFLKISQKLFNDLSEIFQNFFKIPLSGLVYNFSNPKNLPKFALKSSHFVSTVIFSKSHQFFSKFNTVFRNFVKIFIYLQIFIIFGALVSPPQSYLNVALLRHCSYIPTIFPRTDFSLLGPSGIHISTPPLWFIIERELLKNILNFLGGREEDERSPRRSRKERTRSQETGR